MNAAAQEKTGQVLPFPGEESFITDWDRLPLLLSPKWILKALPPDTLGRDAVYNLWNIKGFPGLRAGGKLVVGRDAFRQWIQNPQGA